MKTLNWLACCGVLCFGLSVVGCGGNTTPAPDAKPPAPTPAPTTTTTTTTPAPTTTTPADTTPAKPGDTTPAKPSGDTVKIGVLHSLSGTMAISETSLRDVVLMAVEEINKPAACWASRSSRSSSIRPPTGPCLPKRPSN